MPLYDAYWHGPYKIMKDRAHDMFKEDYFPCKFMIDTFYERTFFKYHEI